MINVEPQPVGTAKPQSQGPDLVTVPVVLASQPMHPMQPSSQRLASGIKTGGKQPTPVRTPLAAAPTSVRPRSVDNRFKDMKGVNVHIHNLKNVSCQRPYKVRSFFY
jgi:hypothetical protein